MFKLYDLEAASDAYYAEKFENESDMIPESEIAENPTVGDLEDDSYEMMYFDPSGNLYEEF